MAHLFCLTLAAAVALHPAASAADAPAVTAKGWAVLDGATGTVLWGDHADEPRKAASTTKVGMPR